MCLNPQVFRNPHALRLLPFVTDWIVNGVHMTSCKDVDKLSKFCYLERDVNNRIHDLPENCERVAKSTYVIAHGIRIPYYIMVPCGRCELCRDARRQDYENRMLFEASDNPYMVFFTLTYDDEHLPLCGLVKEHVALFLKNFRVHITRAHEDGVFINCFLGYSGHTIFKNPTSEPHTITLSKDYDFRCVYVGEYGVDSSKTRRPHYHGVMFFTEPITKADLISLQKLFCEKWEYGRIFGFEMALNPMASARYICKYITKMDVMHVPQRKNPTFIQTPRKCGLGAYKLDEHTEDILKSDSGCIYLRFPAGKVCRVKVSPFLLNKIFKPLSSYCVSASYKLHAVELIANELIRRDVDLPCLRLCDLSYLDYFNPHLFRKSTRTKLSLLACFLPELTTSELLETFHAFCDDLLKLPDESVYLGTLDAKTDYIDRITQVEIPIDERIHKKVNKRYNNLFYVNNKMLSDNFI